MRTYTSRSPQASTRSKRGCGADGSGVEVATALAGEGAAAAANHDVKDGDNGKGKGTGKGKGKGKGGGGKAASSGQSVGMSAAFSGKCLGCNITGHHVKDCRKTSKEDKERSGEQDAHKSASATEYPQIGDIYAAVKKRLHIHKKEPTLDDVAAYLRPAAKRLKVGPNIFKQYKLKPLAGKDGVEYWGWNVQNKRPGAENEWVFVAVEEVKK